MTKMNLDKSGGPKASLPPPEEKRAIESVGTPSPFFPQSVWGGDAGAPDADDTVRTGVGEDSGNDAGTGAQGVPPSTHPLSKTSIPTGTGAGEGSVIIKKVGAVGDAGGLSGKPKPGDSGG